MVNTHTTSAFIYKQINEINLLTKYGKKLRPRGDPFITKFGANTPTGGFWEMGEVRFCVFYLYFLLRRLWYSIETAKYITKLFHRRVAPPF